LVRKELDDYIKKVKVLIDWYARNCKDGFFDRNLRISIKKIFCGGTLRSPGRVLRTVNFTAHNFQILITYIPYSVLLILQHSFFSAIFCFSVWWRILMDFRFIKKASRVTSLPYAGQLVPVDNLWITFLAHPCG